MTRPKIALTGASGYLGSHFVQKTLMSNFPVLSLARSKHPVFSEQNETFQEFISENIVSKQEVYPALEKFGPDALVHIAAESSPIRCEKDPELSKFVNIHYSQILIEFCKRHGVPFYFVSSDLVFEGSEATEKGFCEDASPEPLCVYARAKRQIELEVLAMSTDSAVLRSCLQFGAPIPGTRGMEDWLHQAFRSASKASPVKLFHDEWRTPVYVGDVAESLLRLVSKRLTGIFHAAGPEILNRTQLGMYFAGCYDYPVDMIQAVSRNMGNANPPRAENVALLAESSAEKLEIRFVAPRDHYGRFHYSNHRDPQK